MALNASRLRLVEQQHRDTAADQGIIKKLALADQYPGDHPAWNIAPLIAGNRTDEDADHDAKYERFKMQPALASERNR